ncbi:hypothetical protein [Mycoplasmopsis iners]|uniref:hypothetical protein n=1 Tax=Mycoplasmopsis iners TaxID=76630 RepID=UPI000495F301|nr:hypothetical protein [Mycoplasmopsis iners]
MDNRKNIHKFWADSNHGQDYFVNEQLILEQPIQKTTKLDEEQGTKEQVTTQSVQETSVSEKHNKTASLVKPGVRNKYNIRDLIKGNFFPIVALLITFLIMLLAAWFLMENGSRYDLYKGLAKTAKDHTFLRETGYYFSKFFTNTIYLLIDKAKEKELSYLLFEVKSSAILVAFTAYIVFLVVFMSLIIISIWKLISLFKVNFIYGIVATALTLIIVALTLLIFTVARTSSFSYIQMKNIVDSNLDAPKIKSQGRWWAYFLIAINLIVTSSTAFVYVKSQSNPKFAA